MSKVKTKSVKKDRRRVPKNGQSDALESPDVLTLAEAAAYLRVNEADVVHAARESGLHGRLIGKEWRFLKSAVQAWLCGCPSPRKFWDTQLGAFRDDPSLHEILKEIHQRRGRSSSEEV